MPNLRIESVSTKADLQTFVTLPWQVYRQDPYWVPPLVSERRGFYDRQKNPFFEHSRAEYFLARREEQVVGRIAAIINTRHNDFHKEQVGFFGAFEVVEDPEAAQALLQRACDWVRAQGMAAIRGPATFSINDECGLLVDGFNTPPTLLTTYNPPRYVEYVEQAGFKKTMDLYAYRLSQEKAQPQALSSKLVRVVEHLKQRSGIKLRRASMRNYWQEAEYIKAIYNAAWTRNWGFVPVTDAEFNHMAGMMKQLIDPDLIFFVEIDGETVGFSLTLPDLNQALRLAYPNPRTPEWITLAKLLWYWKLRSKVKAVRLFALGLREDARLTGIDALLYYETARVALAKGYQWGEISWLLETNTMVNRSAKLMGAEMYKTWRMYEWDLAGQEKP
jgi:GNAT superfamily N-acetyltransferase